MTAAAQTLREYRAPPPLPRQAVGDTGSAPRGPVASNQGNGATADREEEPPWPDEIHEAMIRAEIEGREGGQSTAPRSRRGATKTEEDSTAGPLPTLETVRAVVPVELQKLLEELFRAKLETVRRIPASLLEVKPPGGGAALADEPDITNEPEED